MEQDLGIGIDDLPKTLRDKAMKGEPIGIPGTSTFVDFIAQTEEFNPALAVLGMKAFRASFRTTFESLECYPKGVERGERALTEVNKKIAQGLSKRKQNGDPPPTCKSGCSACCHIQVTLTDSEADVLVRHLREKDVKLDRSLVLHQFEHGRDNLAHVKMPYEKRACPILGEDGNCRAYEARPLVCRKYMVATPAWMCDMRLSEASGIIVAPGAEGAVSAMMALEMKDDPSDDNLPQQLLRRIPEDDGLWKHTKPLEE
jgi:Fe-S-cluster containining protein